MIELSGPISSYSRQKKIDRREETLSVCWVGPFHTPISPKSAAQRHRWMKADHSQELGPFVSLFSSLKPAEEIAVSGCESMLVALAPQPPQEAIDAIFCAADRGARVYVLASPGFGEGKNDPGFRDRINSQILIRRFSGIPVSAILSERGDLGGVWLGSTSTGPSHWWLSLNSAQGSTLFRLFTHLFWHEAIDEAWTGNGNLKFRKITERPFDIPLPSASSAVHLVGSHTNNGLPSGEFWHSPDGILPPEHQATTLIVPASGQIQIELQQALNERSCIVWDEIGLPSFSINPQHSVLELGQKRWQLHIHLDSNQSQALLHITQMIKDTPVWRLQKEVKLGSIETQVWLPEAQEPVSVTASVDIDCGTLVAKNIRDIPQTSPAQFPSPPTLALEAVWNWIVEPPRAPKEAQEDSLVVIWEKIDALFSQRVQEVNEKLDGLEEREGMLKKAFTSLAGAILGFGRTRRDMHSRLETLQEKQPSQLGPNDSRELFSQLEALESQLEELEGEVEQSERQEREKREKAEQQKAWEEKCEDTKKKLSELEEQLFSLEEQLENIETGFAEAKDIEDRKDRRAKQKKLRDEQKRTEKQLKKLEQEKAELQGLLDTPFEYKPTRRISPGSRTGSRSKKARFIPKKVSSNKVDIPEERLPSTGRLLQHKGTRYLAIIDWEELEEGEREAERLGAELVVIGGQG